MAKCANDKCNKDPLNSIGAVCVNADGDFACCKKCQKEYEKQKEEFFENIGDDNFFEDYMGLDLNFLDNYKY